MPSNNQPLSTAATTKIGGRYELIIFHPSLHSIHYIQLIVFLPTCSHLFFSTGHQPTIGGWHCCMGRLVIGKCYVLSSPRWRGCHNRCRTWANYCMLSKSKAYKLRIDVKIKCSILSTEIYSIYWFARFCWRKAQNVIQLWWEIPWYHRLTLLIPVESHRTHLLQSRLYQSFVSLSRTSQSKATRARYTNISHNLYTNLLP